MSLDRENNDDRSQNQPKQQSLLESESTELQQDTELECSVFFVNLHQLKPDQISHLRQTGLLSPDDPDNFDVCLLKDKHEQYLRKALGTLKSSFVSLDASRPWILYWTLHSLDLMDRLPPEDVLCSIVYTLKACWQWLDLEVTPEDVDLLQQEALVKACLLPRKDDGNTEKKPPMLRGGGFGGGPGQMAHCATTYAAILTLSIVATTTTSSTPMPTSQRLARALLRDIRWPLWAWYFSLRHGSTGGFRMHHDGEIDVRAAYTIVCCAKILQLDNVHRLMGLPPPSSSTSPTSGTDDNCSAVDFILQCQTYEGGFGGEPWAEAHGGYTYCAVAALNLLNTLSLCNTSALRGWLVRRQMAYEGGFQGRSNKLVDGCYSFWQGGALAILSVLYNKDQGETTPAATAETDPWLVSDEDLTENATTNGILLFDQAMLQRYILLCAQDVQGGLRDKPSKPRDFYHSCYNLSGLSISQHCNPNKEDANYGHATQSPIAATHPCYNIRRERVQAMLTLDWERIQDDDEDISKS